MTDAERQELGTKWWCHTPANTTEWKYIRSCWNKLVAEDPSFKDARLFNVLNFPHRHPVTFDRLVQSILAGKLLGETR